MDENKGNIHQLLDFLFKRQDAFSRELNDLREEVNQLRTAQGKAPLEKKKEIETVSPTIDVKVEPSQEPVRTSHQEQFIPQPPKANKIPEKSNLEKFIGENLINKIGIAITVIGVAIGAKYSIEHQLISPLTRIILGYLMGIGLLGFGIKLKQNFEKYSAVLVSGAIAIMYFITYAAYSFYDLMPQAAAFSLMLVFTVFAVIAAIKYNMQVIAHIGLVGAYAVPMLLGGGSGKVLILFSYIAIINIGILVIAFKKYWKPLYYSSFIFTWLIFFAWFVSKYRESIHFELCLSFLSIYFIIFYSIFLSYKLLQKENFNKGDIILLISNAFIFYGLGYSTLSFHSIGKELLGLFTLGNAIIHFSVCALIYKQKLADRNLFFLVAGLVLVFITIAVPVQLDGNWVTLLWAAEAALLFWIGRTKNVSVYEKLSYPLMFMAFFSLIQDWRLAYDFYSYSYYELGSTPIFNIHFLSSLLFAAAFTFINYLNSKRKLIYPIMPQGISQVISYCLPAILLIVIYFSFALEISAYWNEESKAVYSVQNKMGLYDDSASYYAALRALDQFKVICLIDYTLLFFSVLSFINIKKIRNLNLSFSNMGLNVLSLIAFLTIGLYGLSELREKYFDLSLSPYFYINNFSSIARYASFVFVGLILFSTYKYLQQDFLKRYQYQLNIGFDLLLHISLVWIASSELINWMDIMDSSQSYRFGLSILWGTYALLLIIIGIWKKKKHLRIGAIVLFAITLLKLFAYDISNLETIAKTIVFVALGILLLIISFLYNKYKHLIFEENEK